MSRLCLYYVQEPERDRWIPGDRFVRPLVRRLLRGRPRPGGVDKVFLNLRLGLDRLGISYEINLPFRQLQPDDRVAILGRGRNCLLGYDRPNKIVAGIGLMTHPSEWPTLCDDYPVVRYLQHSAWCDAVYRPFYGDRCAIWPVGIETDRWQPAPAANKTTDFLVYDKIHWDRHAHETTLVQPALTELARRNCSFETLRYGSYSPDAYRNALSRCRALLFFSPHESQGIACQEAMSAGLPVLAWDPGFVQDPARFSWRQPEIPATSVPHFDDRCGRRFRNATEFSRELPMFLDDLHASRLRPRDYILENLTLEKCARHFVELCEQAQQDPVKTSS